MLELTIGQKEVLTEDGKFVKSGGTPLAFEHSLLALSKWEEHWEIPFLSSDRTPEQTLHYLKLMCLTPEVSDEVWLTLNDDDVKAIQEYIGRKATATWIAENPDVPGSRPGKKDIITAEIIYYWVIAMNIPIEFQLWHLNKLLMLIRVCNEKNTPPDQKKKMSKNELIARNRRLNAERRAKLNTRG